MHKQFVYIYTELYKVNVQGLKTWRTFIANALKEQLTFSRVIFLWIVFQFSLKLKIIVASMWTILYELSFVNVKLHLDLMQLSWFVMHRKLKHSIHLIAYTVLLHMPILSAHSKKVHLPII